MTPAQEQAQAKTAMLLREAFDELLTPAYKERTRLFAADKRAKFLAYIDAGFTESQALELCKGPA